MEQANEAAAPADAGALRALAERLGLEFVETVGDDLLDPELVRQLPVEWARTRTLLPVRLRGAACALTPDPSQLAAIQDLSLLLGADLRPVVAPAAEVRRAIERCYFSRSDTHEQFLRELDAPAPAAPAAEAAGSDDLLRMANETPVTQLVNLILLGALKSRASDVHFEPFASRLRVRYRIDGDLYEQAAPPKHMEQALVSRLKIMCHMDIAEKRLPQDGAARVRVGDREIDVRASAVPVADGERVVLRLLDRQSALLPLGELGMSAAMLERYGRHLRQSYGLILVCGPTGSGKTTTLYATLQQIDAARRNIITIEDPIEYQLPDIGQIQVKPKIGLTFASGLRHIVRQDPDVILVGETRDRETADIATRSSLTGHLVFTTLHTNDAPSAVMRLTDMGVEPFLLASSLRAALAQRLVRRLCHRCRAPAGAAGGGWRAVGCPECLGGYRGRTGIFELMEVDDEIREMVRVGKCAAHPLKAMAVAHGMTTLREDGAGKVAQGATSEDELVRVLGRAEA